MTNLTPTCIVEAQFAPAVSTTIYTSPIAGIATIIDKFTATNTDGSTHTLTVYLVPNGGGAGTSTTIIDAASLTSGTITDFSTLQNQILNAGDQIVVLADTGGFVVVRASGRVIS